MPSISALQAGVDDRQLRGPAHQVERRRAFVLAIGRQSDAGDEAHGALNSSFRGPPLGASPGMTR